MTAINGEQYQDHALSVPGNIPSRPIRDLPVVRLGFFLACVRLLEQNARIIDVWSFHESHPPV